MTGADARGRARGGRPRRSSRATSCSSAPAATRSTPQPDYMARGPGVTAEATHWLYEQGVRVMGIDAWGWDAPLHLQAAGGVARDEPGDLLGRAPGRPALLPDRAAVQPRRAAADAASRSPASR